MSTLFLFVKCVCNATNFCTIFQFISPIAIGNSRFFSVFKFQSRFINRSFESNDGVEIINMTILDFNTSVDNCVALEDFGAGGVPNIDLIDVYGWGTYPAINSCNFSSLMSRLNSL